jgi:hypothetical protein
MANSQDEILKLSPDEAAILEAVKAKVTSGTEMLTLLRDLRSERQLEFHIYSSREQWFWVHGLFCLREL